MCPGLVDSSSGSWVVFLFLSSGQIPNQLTKQRTLGGGCQSHPCLFSAILPSSRPGQVTPLHCWSVPREGGRQGGKPRYTDVFCLALRLEQPSGMIPFLRVVLDGGTFPQLSPLLSQVEAAAAHLVVGSSDEGMRCEDE